jgi:hypothetical protein
MKKNLILIAAPHRTGSTLLYDCIRMANNILPDPSYKLWRTLGCKRGTLRYPRDLSSHLQSHQFDYRIKHSFLRDSFIPSLGCNNTNSTWSIEKFHFHFFNAPCIQFPDQIFLEHNVHLVLSIRNPFESIQSFINYKSRADWEQSLSSDLDSLIDLYINSYLFMIKLASLSSFASVRVFDYVDWLTNSRTFSIGSITYLLDNFTSTSSLDNSCTMNHLIEQINLFRASDSISSFRGLDKNKTPLPLPCDKEILDSHPSFGILSQLHKQLTSFSRN